MTDRSFESFTTGEEKKPSVGEFKDFSEFDKQPRPEEFSAARDLLELGRNTGNEMVILEPKKIRHDIYQPNYEVFKSDKFSKSDSAFIFNSLNELSLYRSGPLITDSFDKDNLARNAWEQKAFAGADKRTENYYNDNRLRRNRFLRIKNTINEFLRNDYLKEEAGEQLKQIDKEFDEISETYGLLELEKKLAADKIFTAQADKLLEILGVKFDKINDN